MRAIFLTSAMIALTASSSSAETVSFTIPAGADNVNIVVAFNGESSNKVKIRRASTNEVFETDVPVCRSQAKSEHDEVYVVSAWHRKQGSQEEKQSKEFENNEPWRPSPAKIWEGSCSSARVIGFGDTNNPAITSGEGDFQSVLVTATFKPKAKDPEKQKE